MTAIRVFILTLLVVVTSHGPTRAVDPAFADMPMRDFSQISMFVRADILRSYREASPDPNGFSACMLAAAADPRSWGMTVAQAISSCKHHVAEGKK